MRKIQQVVVLVAGMLFAGTSSLQGSVVDSDFEGIDFMPSPREPLAVNSLSAPAAEPLAAMLLDNLSRIPGRSGETLLPLGTVCDQVRIEQENLEAFLTLPEELLEEDIRPMAFLSAGELLLSELGDAAGVTSVRIYARRGPDSEYRNARDFIPKRDYPPVEDGAEQAVPRKETKQTGAAVIGPIGPAGTQPTGALSGKIVYLTGGHGWTWHLDAEEWYAQRPLMHEMVEDYGNIDQLNFLVHYLFNAGATVVVFRPVGLQPDEVVLDNDDSGVTFSGSWTDSTSTVFFGDPGDVPFRYAGAGPVENATARYRPGIPEDGFYPVYCWTQDGSDRVSDQLYRIKHSGGLAEVKVNHRRVGKGWIWLGSYYLRSGTDSYVEISNLTSDSTPGRIVIADAIRWGCGVGDLTYGSGGVSGYCRDEECARYWIQKGLGEGSPSGIYNIYGSSHHYDCMVAPAYMTRHMNREVESSTRDCVYLLIHSNATEAHTSRSVIAYYPSVNPIEGAVELATYVADEVNGDMLALAATWDMDWYDRSSRVRSLDYWFLSTNYSFEMPGINLEVAFHDEPNDAAILRDGRARNMIARATYQAIVRFFNYHSGSPLILLPDPPTHLRVVKSGPVTVNIAWNEPVVDGIGGDAATGFKLYHSTNGYGFDAGRAVIGTSTAVTGLAPGQTHYFKVAATNAGGESLGSEVLGIRAWESGGFRILVVNGFERFDRNQNAIDVVATNLGSQFGPGGNVDRIKPLQINSFDYIVQYAEAIAASGFGFDSCSNEAVADGQVNLRDYQALVWISGEESSTDQVLEASEQAILTDYLTGGGQLFISGSEIAWELDYQNYGRSFCEDILGSNFVGDDAGTYTVMGSGGIFSEISPFDFSVTDGAPYDVERPDQIEPSGLGVANLTYVGGSGGTAGIQQKTGVYRVVHLGFPFECIASEEARNEVMAAVLNYFVFVTGTGDWDAYR